MLFKNLISIQEVQKEFADEYQYIITDFDKIIADAAEVNASDEDIKKCVALMNNIDEIVATTALNEAPLDCKNRKELIKKHYAPASNVYS